jgi:hypothetical protein
MDKDKRSNNSQFLADSLDKFKTKVLDALKDDPSGFFTGHLQLSVQDGVIRTRKVALEECEHAVIGK